jgi:hypothetical protein
LYVQENFVDCWIFQRKNFFDRRHFASSLAGF